MRRRYRRLTASHSTGYERLFVGLVPGTMFLKTSGTGTDALMREFLAIVFILIIGPALVNYATWLDLEKQAYNIPSEVQAADIGLPDFIYQSVVTITTGSGYISPKKTSVQFVSAFQIVLGWMYLIALFPLLLSSVQRRAKFELRWHRCTSARGGMLGTVVRSGLDSLRKRRSAAGSWSSKLSHDSAATYFALWALEAAERHLPISREVKMILESQARGATLVHNDNLAIFLGKLHDFRQDNSANEEVQKLILDICDKNAFEESQENFLKWLGLLLFQDSSINSHQELLSVKLPSVEDWERHYGRHWSTYAMVARLVYTHFNGYGPEAKELAKKLVRARSDSVSWFGDCLLTSLCVLALARIDKQRTVWHAAALWLAEVTVEHECMPLVRNLDVWHTGLALEVLHLGGAIPETALQWLMKQFHKTPMGSGWSWTSESGIICLDSTSTVVRTIRALDVKDIMVHRYIEAAQLTLFEARRQITEGSLKMPTFIDSEEGIDVCPIILARSLHLLNLPPQDRRLCAESLVQQISDGHKSPWFKHPGITKGLVLWHIALYLPHESKTVYQLVGDLIEYATDLDNGAHVTRASVLLGLLASRRLIKTGDVSETIERLVNNVLASQEDGRWPGEAVGVFGFGRLYADDHLATVLSLHALMEYAGSFPTIQFE